MGKPSILILGLDGVGPELVRRFREEGILPNISELIERGTWGSLRSTTPPTTLPAWTSFMTGAAPSTHGVPDFTIREGYRVRFVGGSSRAVPTVFHHLEKNGLTCGVAWFPATYPPEPLRGYQIAGWDSPVTSTGDTSFVHPDELHRGLQRRFGGDHLSFDAIDEFSDDESWYQRTAEKLPLRVHRRAEMALWLLEHHPVDVAAFYFGEADTAAHHFWAFHDESSPRRPSHVDPRLGNAIRDVYAALDRAVGKLVQAAGPETAVVVLSDHGSGGASDVVLHINRMLERVGLLAFLPRRRRFAFEGRWLRGVAPSLVPKSLRRRLFTFADGLAPSLVESAIRFGGIDWLHSQFGFSQTEELTYAPSIWINQRGREPKGQVGRHEREEVCREVERAARDVLAPDGEPVVKRVIRRDDLHRGPYSHIFPDVVLELHPVDGHLPVCLPSAGRAGDVVTRLEGTELLGRKGRSLPGCHTPDGVLIVVGEGARAGGSTTARLEDVAPVVSALAGTPGAPWFEGSPLHGLPHGAAHPEGEAPGSRADRAETSYTPDEERAIAERLRLLGYLE